jgi:hypothetical protein
MINSSPITPPPELVEQWIPAGWNCSPNTFTTLLMRIADNAALWSHDHCRSEIKAAADQELEACVEWIAKRSPLVSSEMQAARRPKPPTLKEQALLELDSLSPSMKTIGVDTELLRRAIEALPND